MKSKITATKTNYGKNYLWYIYVNDKIQPTKIVTNRQLTERQAINEYLSLTYHN